MSVASTDTSYLTRQEVMPRHAASDRLRHRLNLCLAVVVLLLLGSEIWLRVATVRAGYLLEQLRVEALKSDTEIRELRVKLAALTNPQLLSERAKSELGLYPTPPQRVRMLELPADIDSLLFDSVGANSRAK